MDPMPNPEVSDETLARVVAVAYGDATLTQRVRLARQARRHPVVRELLAEHRRIAAAIRSLSLPRAPTEVIDRACVEIEREAPGARRVPLRPGGQAIFASGLALTAACTILIALLVRQPASAPESMYTQAEVEEARIQIEAAFALVNRSVARAGVAVNDDILAPNLARPIRNGRAIIQGLFGKENAS